MKGLAILEIVAFHFFADHSYHSFGTITFQALDFEGVKHVMQTIFLGVTRIGSQGIHIFFFLSGFGLSISSASKQIGGLSYVYRRMSRVYPSFLISIFFVVILQLSTGMRVGDEAYLESAIASILLVQNYSGEWIRSINGDWWFVTALIPMYLIYSLLREYIKEWPLKIALVAFLISLLYKIFLVFLLQEKIYAFDAGSLNPFTAFFLNYFWEFIAGAAIYHANIVQMILKASVLKVIILFCFGVALEFVGASLSASEYGRIFNDDVFFVAQLLLLTSIFIFFQCFISNFIVFGLERILVLFGATSYGLYLIHHPISKMLKYFGFVSDSLIVIVFVFFLYIVACWRVGVFLEKISTNIFFQKRSN